MNNIFSLGFSCLLFVQFEIELLIQVNVNGENSFETDTKPIELALDCSASFVRST